MGTWHKELGVILEERVVREGFRQAMEGTSLGDCREILAAEAKVREMTIKSSSCLRTRSKAI